MTNYTDIVTAEEMILDRTPRSGDTAQRSVDELHLVIEEDGDVGLSTRTYYGGDGTPMDEWHRCTLVYRLAKGPGVVDLEALREDLAEGAPLAQAIDTIKAGHSVVWDGNNYVGRLTEEAQNAGDEIEHLAEDGRYLDEKLALWDAGEWLYGSGPSLSAKSVLEQAGLTVDATDEAIKAAAETAVASARGDDAIIDESDVVEVFRRCIETVKADDADEEV